MKQKIAAIYKIINNLNNKLYVGSASDEKIRWQQHKQNLQANKHHSSHLQNAWNKYGKQVFEFIILEIIDNPTKQLLEAREQYWIDYYDAANPDKGYNICKKAGTVLGIKRSKETKEKMSRAKKGHPISEKVREIFKHYNLGNKHNLGKKRTTEQIENIRKGHEGQIVSDYARQRSYEVRMQKPYWNLGLTKENDPRIAKMAESRKGQEPWNKDSWKEKVSAEEVKKFYLNDHTALECATKFNIKEYSITQILKQLGILRNKSEALILAHKRKNKNGPI